MGDRVHREYEEKKVGAAEAMARVESGNQIFFGEFTLFPKLCDAALADRRDQLTDIDVDCVCYTQMPKMVEVDPDGDHFTINDWHFGGISRKLHKAGRCNYIPLNTPSGLIEIASQAYAEAGGEALPLCQLDAPDEQHPLRLVSPHPRFRIHSQTGGNTRMGHKDKATLWLSEADAKKRNIEDGDLVAITNDHGRVHVEASVSYDIMEGVVCLLEGTWPIIESGVDTGGSPNMLTSTEPTLPSEGSRTHSVRVEVSKVTV